jgi:hypothetical protein
MLLVIWLVGGMQFTPPEAASRPPDAGSLTVCDKIDGHYHGTKVEPDRATTL